MNQRFQKLSVSGRTLASYAPAYAALGLSLIEAVGSGWTEFVADALDRAETLGQKALSLDPASTVAYRLLAQVDVMRGRFDLALSQVDRALEINPSDAESYMVRGNVLVWAGRSAEALLWLEGALRFDRANTRTSLLLGMAYYLLDRYGEAVEAVDRALAGNLGRNTQLMGRPVLAASYAQLNKPQDAERERTTVMRMSPFLDAERFRRTIRHARCPRPHARRAEKGGLSLSRALSRIDFNFAINATVN